MAGLYWRDHVEVVSRERTTASRRYDRGSRMTDIGRKETVRFGQSVR